MHSKADFNSRGISYLQSVFPTSLNIENANHKMDEGLLMVHLSFEFPRVVLFLKWSLKVSIPNGKSLQAPVFCQKERANDIFQR